MHLLSELKRRNVVRVGIAYLVTAWLVLQVADLVLDNVPAPDWVMQVFLLTAAFGLPIALLIAWSFEITADGVKLDSNIDRSQPVLQSAGRKLDFTIIGILAVAVVFFAVDKFLMQNVTDLTQTTQASIAVLPFVNFSSDPEQAYFSDGLTEEMLNLLAKIPALKVTSRSSSFFYKGKDIKITEVGRELGVSYILEGSERRSKDQIRITAQLINSKEDKHLWSQTWDRKMDDVFTIQDEIAAAVVVALRVRLLGELPSAARTAPQAYALYLRAIELINRSNADGMLKAEAALHKALEIDSTYIPAWLRLAEVYHTGGSVGAWHPIESFPKARNAAEEVLRLDASNVPALLMMSMIALEYDYDHDSAIAYLEHAKTLGPNSKDLWHYEIRAARLSDDFALSIRLTEAALQRDPKSTRTHYVLGLTYMLTGRMDDAKKSLRRAIELSSNSAGSRFYLGAIFLLEGDFDSAKHHFELEIRDGYRAMGRALLFYAQADNDQADQALKDLIALGYRWTYQIASVYAYRNEADNAFIWLDRAMDRRDTSILSLRRDPFMDNIREDPRLAQVYKRMGIAHKAMPVDTAVD